MALHFGFEGTKNIHVLQVLILGFGERWRFLTWVWHLDLDLERVSGVYYTYALNFGSLS